MKPYKLLASVMCLALVLSACAPVIVPPAGEAVQPAAASAETTAEIELKPHQPRPDAPKYALRGPFGVGVRDMLVQPAKDGDRPLRVNVWYPALIPQGAKEAVTYKMDFLADPAAGFPTGGRALRDAAPNPASGPYPLVLYSHGSWCFREIASLFLEHLASHGFVVMAPLHEDNWGNMYQPTWRSEISRPRDMVRTLDFAEALTASGGAMAGLIDTAHVAVKGHSFGGRIALEMGGARLNVKEWLENYCVAYPKDMRCVGYPEHLEEMAALAGFEALPEGLWPDWSDPRIDVVVATGPSVNMLGGGGLDGLRRPVLLLYGTLDTSAGAAIEYRRLYESLPGRQKTRVLFEGAGHMIFGNACPAYPGMVKAGYHMFCSDPVWDVDRAHDLTNHFVTAFLLAELKGDAEAAKALAPDKVSFPGIRYETTAYGAAAKEAAAPPKPRGLRPDAPTYGVRGPYPVGVRNFAIAAGAEKQRPLNVTIWYPALNPKGLPEEYTYEMRFAPGQFPLWKIFGHAIRNADPATTDGPYPLVVYSHAHWSFAQEFPHLLEHLASRGFVVISADHEDNWSTAFGPKAWQTEFQRPQEVTREINYAESLSAAGGVLEGLIDAKRVAVAGWSYGGQTALMSVGARLDLVGLRAWCEKNTVGEQPPVRDCVELLPYEKELAAFSGLNQVPKGLWPDWGDARVDAAIAMAPPAVFGATGLQTVKAPVMFMAASDDAMVGPLYKASDPYKQVAVEQKIEIVFDRASHLLFTGSCENEPDLVAMGFHSFCAEPVWDKSRAHDLINHFVTAFLLAELKGDAEAAKALAAEKVSFPGIQYQSAGYGAAAEPKAKLDTDTIAKIEALVAKEMADKDIPGVSLGIVKDSQVAYAKGFGVAERGTDRPMTPQTQFAVACITKGFTTAAIMQLVEQGLVKLDAPVTDYLPYFKLADERYREITIHHLLANTAGLPMPDYVKLYGGFSQNPSWSPDLLEKYVRSLADKPMTKDPTENTFVYGGDYFDILGDVIAKASGQPFEEYMEEHILRPLGLEHTTFIVDDLDPKLAAAAHWQDANGEMQVSVPSPTYYPAHTPSNGMFSTTEDLLKWAIFNLNRGKLDGRQIVAASAYEEMWKPQVKIPWGGIIQHWGYGWGISDVEGHRLVFWGGGHIGSG
ncbi:MAG: hypothetical protein FJ280_24190, partial [Planctomycetes bacterium]|nr:hypothetical protein [Planctomycetota bacterium]